MQVAAIVPIRISAKREQRVSLKVDMDFMSLLEKYLDTKEELKDSKEQLLEKAKILYSQVNSD